jgi:hypothetical protein
LSSSLVIAVVVVVFVVSTHCWLYLCDMMITRTTTTTTATTTRMRLTGFTRRRRRRRPTRTTTTATTATTPTPDDDVVVRRRWRRYHIVIGADGCDGDEDDVPTHGASLRRHGRKMKKERAGSEGKRRKNDACMKESTKLICGEPPAGTTKTSDTNTRGLTTFDVQVPETARRSEGWRGGREGFSNVADQGGGGKRTKEQVYV